MRGWGRSRGASLIVNGYQVEGVVALHLVEHVADIGQVSPAAARAVLKGRAI